MEEKRTKEIEEIVIEPELRICDAHHHLWDIAGEQYMTQDLLRDIGGQKVVKTVCVEAWGHDQRSENRFKEPAEQTAFAVADSAKNKGDIQVAAGIVGYADLMEGAGIAKVIEAHFSVGQGRFRGIRMAPGSIFNDAKFVEGFRHIVKYNLTVDLVIHYQQLLELKALANRYPEVPIVINHLGLVMFRHSCNNHAAGNPDENLRLWKIIVDSLAECQSLFMKLGGLGMDMAGAGWNKPTKPNSVELAAIMKPWFTYCIEKFGPERCMFESNFPVDKRSFSYTVYWNAAKSFSKEYSRSERDALFFGTATKVYRLE
jgi:L-fuconolactonase